tara:strand:- start:11754 stop:12185 length:432 start_codon:yes stop_codon:yes gene_type:complete
MHRLLIQLGIDARLSPAQAETLSEALTECGTAKADYLDLQRQHEELKTMLFNERQNAKELAAQVEQLQRTTFDVVCASAILGVPIHEEESHKCLAARDAEIKAQAIRSFVSDTNEAGQLSWSDAQWLEDWRDEWLSQSAKAGS